MAKRAKRDVVLKWLADRPKATAAEAAKEFGWSATTISKWLGEEGLDTRRTPKAPRPPKPESERKPPASRARVAGAAPAIDLTEDDRVEALAIVRASRRVMRKAYEAWADLEEGFPDRDDAQAVLHIQRGATGVIETHPGLMKLAADPKADKEAARDLDAVMKALGLTKEES